MPTTPDSYDVVVVGCGAAGSAAALAAHESGARVLVLEKTERERAGGATRVSGGAWFINRDPARAEVYFHNLQAGRPVDPEVAAVWATETALNTEWLRSLGAEVDQCMAFGTRSEYPEVEGSDAFGGMDSIRGELGNHALIGFLHAALAERDIEVRYGVRAEELLRDADGAVTAIRTSSTGGTGGSGDASGRIEVSGGVVLATGSFEADPSMVRDYLRMTDVVRWGHPDATGDGQKMAMAIGADLWHMDNMMSAPGVRGAGEGDAGLLLAPWHGNGYLFVDDLGRRFVDEMASPRHGIAFQHGQYLHFPTASFHVVLDERMLNAGPLATTPTSLPVGWPILEEGQGWSADNSAEIADGRVVRADSLAELAELIGVDATVLERTVELYTSAVDRGVDDWFGRPPERMQRVDTAPYYAVRSVPLLGWSNGGPRRDAQSRVLDTAGRPIDGLYAAGSVSSSYSWGKDQGFHLADAFVFGRISGRGAARRAGH